MSTQFPDDHDPLAARLRAALHSEADMVEPTDTLSSIRSRIEAKRRPWWQHPGVLAVAAAGVIGLAVGAFLFGLGGDDGTKGKGVVAQQSNSPTATATPSEPPSPSPSDSPVPVEGNVYVYYLMDDPDAGGPRLYREEHPNPGAAPLVAGVQAMLTDPASDPDYASPWPKGTTINDTSVSGDTATVDLSDFVDVGASFEAAAVQQLVYTVTANDKSVKQVQLLINGKTPPSGHSDWSKPVSRAPMVDAQGLIWLLGPTEGETVSSPVEIDGYGTAFEATISWEVRQDNADGPKVAEGNTQGGANGDFGEFRDTVDLPAGTYEIRAYEASGEDGHPIHIDTKTFTVR